MREITKPQLKKILVDHKKWLNGDGGARADLRHADLRHVDLRHADLYYADLRHADLRHADIRSINGIRWAVCGWSEHGECGRQLLGVIVQKEIVFYCGCFMGPEKELRTYIKEGDAVHKESRRKAMNFVLSCLKQGANDE